MLTQAILFARKIKRLKFTYAIFFILCSVVPMAIATALRNKSNLLFHLLVIGSGWLTWTYIEYFFHRFAMHTKKNHKHSPVSRKHQHHHHSPGVLDVTLLHRILLCVLSCLFFFLAWKWDNYFSFFAGLIWGASAFCYIHYLLHLHWTRKILPVHHYFHICHHCKYPDRCFGVSVTWWDHLFSTTPPDNFTISKRATEVYYI